MGGRLAVRAEIVKLARLYRVEESALEFLEPLTAEAIRTFRLAVQERLFGDDHTLFRRLALAGRLLPVPLLAMMAENIFGPVLAARVAGEMDARRAVELAGRLPVGFLADVSVQLDPRRAENILRRLPAARVRDVAAELLRRREFVIMGRIVDHLDEAAIRESLDAFTEAADLLQVAFFVENRHRLDDLIRMLDDARLRAAITAAQDPARGLWPEALALMAFVDDDLRRRMGDLVVAQDEAALDGLVATAHRLHLWGDVLPVVACMSAPALEKLLRLRALSDPAVMEGVLRGADANGLWPAFLPLVRLMAPEQLALVAGIAVARLPAQALEHILHAADAAGLWEDLLQFAESMNEAQLDRIAVAASSLPGEAIGRVLDVADELDLWNKLLPLASRMSAPHKKLVARHAGLVPPGTQGRILAAARASDERLWPALLDVVACIPREQRRGFAALIAEEARRTPELVERLAPAVEARGLDDLLAVAREALRTAD